MEERIAIMEELIKERNEYPKIFVSDKTVFMYEKKDKKSKILGAFRPGVTLEILGPEMNGWVKIAFETHKGYMEMKHE